MAAATSGGRGLRNEAAAGSVLSRRIYPSLALAGFLAYITIKAVVMYVQDVCVNRGLLSAHTSLFFSLRKYTLHSGKTDTYKLDTDFQHCIAGGRDQKPPSVHLLTWTLGKHLVSPTLCLHRGGSEETRSRRFVRKSSSCLSFQTKPPTVEYYRNLANEKWTHSIIIQGDCCLCGVSNKTREKTTRLRASDLNDLALLFWSSIHISGISLAVGDNVTQLKRK